jgi:Domain of unknown function (DUF4504)
VYEHINFAKKSLYIIEPPAFINRTTLYGVLLGYPVIYWYEDMIDGGGAGRCLSMIPLIVTTATVTFDIKGQCCDSLKTCDIYSFSIPEELYQHCQATVKTWCNQITSHFERRRSMVQSIRTLHLQHQKVVQSAVCL